ncbi:MAG TPA: LPXTG cell wall anchor domain-containing protein [Nocardioidaceae bacterium]|nr:LPXTG cell wall anchor domain-containing protein [Nocardioidaceae bacterium]
MFIALLLALLTLPLGALASAEDLPPGGEVTEGQVLGTTSEEEVLDGQDGTLGEPPPAEEAPAAEEVTPEEPVPAPAPEAAPEPAPAETSEDTAPGSPELMGAAESAVGQVAAIAAFTAGDLETAGYDPADEQGANDEPGQKDLTKLWAWSPSGGILKIGWNWDETGWSGSNTGDACALFDIDQDTSADYAVCVTVEGDPATQLEPGSPRVYECTTQGTNSVTNCLGAELRAGTSTTCEVAQTATNPFVAGGVDTSALCTIDLDDVGGSSSTVLTNICTYPSQQPTSDDSDCVLAPRDAKLTVVKVATPADTSQLFTFDLTTKGVVQQFAKLPAGGSYSAGVSSADDANLALKEDVPDGWRLESATCDNGQSPGKLDLASGEHVTCTFTNEKIRYSDLVVSKTAKPHFDRDYDWSIKKSVDTTRQEIPEGGSATFDYSVRVTPSAPDDSGFVVAGKISVTNPNPVAFTGVDVTDTIAGGNCSVKDGQDIRVPANSTVDLDYTCSMPDATATTRGTNTATATWKASDWYGTDGSAKGSRSFDFADAKTTVSDGSVRVSDDQFDLSEGGAVDTEVKAADGPRTFTYSMTRSGKAGTCSTYPNTAKITERDGGTKTSSQTVEVCALAELQVSKTAHASYDRTYEWDITKVADRRRLETEKGTPGTVVYTVGVTPAGYTDSGWELSGAVTVHNTNDYKDVSVTLTDVPDLGPGVTCAFDETTDLVVEASGSRKFTYSCTFAEKPAYDGGNTVRVDWHGGSVEASSAVVFEVDEETNRTVTITDDRLDPSELGEVTWDESGETVEFEYPMELEGRRDQCDTVTNTATIVETGQQAQADVVVCGPEILPAEKPRPPAKLPETGAPTGIELLSTLGGLLVALGAALLLRRRREAS